MTPFALTRLQTFRRTLLCLPRLLRKSRSEGGLDKVHRAVSRLHRSLCAGLDETFEVNHGGHRSLKPMEGLRGVAVSLVFLVHFGGMAAPLVAHRPVFRFVASLVHDVGNSGVELFFVISGYLIYGSLVRKRQSFVSYFRRRLERIYPTFTCVFLIYLILCVLFPSENKIPHNLRPGLVYVIQNYLLLPGIFPITPIITVAWSLSYEFFFYLTVPILVGALGLRHWSTFGRLILTLTITATILAAPGILGDHVRGAMFGVGALAYEFNSYTSEIKPPAWLAPTALCLALCVWGSAGLLPIPQPGTFRSVGVAFCLFVTAVGAFHDNGCPRCFVFTPLRWLGNMSYSYYLIHGLTLKFFFHYLYIYRQPLGSQAGLFLLAFVASFLATLLTSAALFVTIEKRFSLEAHRPSGARFQQGVAP
jgi:exopolysaccharide production protein ExoZ